jgi:cell division protein FtsN
MKDYKEPISRVQKRHQLKRLFGIMGGMIFAFAIFIVGIKVGIQLERERVRIAHQTTSRTISGEDKEATEGNKKEEAAPASEKKEEKMEFTFYETLTKKEGAKPETQKTEKTVAKKEQAKTTVKTQEAKKPPPPTTKAEKAKKAPVEKELYFVQIASFREQATAEGLKDRLAKKGYKVQVIPVQLEGMGLWYRVRLGGYKSLKEAQAAQKKISFEENFTGTKVVSGQ